MVLTRTEPRAAHRLSFEAPLSASIIGQPVAGTANGLDRVPSERPIELVTEVPHVDLDDVRIALEVVVPDVVEDLALGDDLALASEEELEQRHLARRQSDLRLGAPDALRAGVEPKVADLQDRRALRSPSPQQRAQTGDQNDVRERLRQEVVGAQVQGIGLVDVRRPSRSA